jgi:hypothetical protein
MKKEMKSALIVFLLLKDGKHQQKRENGGLWHVVAAIPLSLFGKTAIFAVYISLTRMDL